MPAAGAPASVAGLRSKAPGAPQRAAPAEPVATVAGVEEKSSCAGAWPASGGAPVHTIRRTHALSLIDVPIVGQWPESSDGVVLEGTSTSYFERRQANDTANLEDVRRRQHD